MYKTSTQREALATFTKMHADVSHGHFHEEPDNQWSPAESRQATEAVRTGKGRPHSGTAGGLWANPAHQAANKGGLLFIQNFRLIKAPRPHSSADPRKPSAASGQGSIQKPCEDGRSVPTSWPWAGHSPQAIHTASPQLMAEAPQPAAGQATRRPVQERTVPSARVLDSRLTPTPPGTLR